eukprot:TRINITY_DN78974_c0_g1_i1.p1 TRINITY_DN78974_c0_g1~~TRINITY_DN78974_c0_g1_i1.p1  ORF type:complete len:396 (+),score=58.87 TRINITY_DN78974_c0_g1_i1:27-1214(+)
MELVRDVPSTVMPPLSVPPMSSNFFDQSETTLPAIVARSVSIAPSALPGYSSSSSFLHRAGAAVSSALGSITVPTVGQVSGSLDGTLRLIGRISAAVLLVLVLALICVWPFIRNKLHTLLPPDEEEQGPNSKSRLRWHKLKMTCYNTVCCSCCCPGLASSLGLDCLKPQVAEQLKVTLITASDLRRRMDFYLEVWTEPLDSHPKISRVQQQASGKVDLGGENLTLDWFGDEDEVVIQAVQYTGPVISRDVAVGDLRISREAVERYAGETANDPEDLSKGTRLFPMKVLTQEEAKCRKRRFGLGGGAPFLPRLLMSLSGDAVHASEEELERLKFENDALKSENETLGGSVSRTLLTDRKSKHAETLMQVAVRFEIVSSSRAPSTRIFKAPSFDDSL